MNTIKRITGITAGTILLAGSVLSGCQSGGTKPSSHAVQPEGKPEKLVWYVRSSEPKNSQAVLNKANERIQEKINATLEMKFINPGDYDSKMQLVMSSGEAYDLAFTSAWANSYVNNVNRGAYIPLDAMIENYPGLKAMMRKEIWDAVKINGKMYGMPNNQIMASQDGIWFKKDIAEKHGINLKTIKSMEDLTQALQTVKDKEPGIIPVREGTTSFSFKRSGTIIEDLFVVNAATWKVEDGVKLQADTFKTFRGWYQKGFFPQDVATLKDELSLIKAGKIFSRYGRQKPGADAELKAAYGFEVVNIPTGQPIIQRSGALSTLTAISSTSKHPELAMKLLDLINTDKELINLLSFGIEGQDYTKLTDNRIEPKPGGYSLPAWMIGNVFNSYLLPGQPDDVWEQTKKLNETALVDPLISFSFDRKNVENEMARLVAIHKEFKPILDNGLDDIDKIIKQREDKLKAAGYDKVAQELKAQIDTWRKTQQ
ncbi:ABC transporter substrate-binding protein [Paenibacillus sp. FSL H8-0034]|uniref:ABC transporter substrate-binding protein n=1 Tax=Paenibacillus sp. FSL H8-0034 TaxID=2954671 RepID=UPI0030F84C09